MSADLEGSEGLRTLVLTPTTDDAVRLARQVNDGLDASGALLVAVSTDPRSLRRLPATSAAAMSIDDGVSLLKRSALKLDRVTSVVLVELDQLTPGSTALDEVLAEVPKDADRVATTAAVTAEIDGILERHARRARHIQHEALPISANATEYVVCDVSQRTEMLGRILDAIDPKHATVIAAEEDAESACTALAQLGYGPEDSLVEFSDGACPKNEELVVLFTAPASADDLSDLAEAEPRRIVTLLLPDEVAAFRRVFGEGARALPLVNTRAATSRVAALRNQIVEALTEDSLHHQLLALAPLFAEHEPAEVAAALLRLYERRPVATPAPAQRAESAPMSTRPMYPSAPAPSPRSRPSPSAGEYATLFVNVGEKDGATKGDLVGAISNEASISSQLIGAITLRQTFALVEVDRSVAQQVIEAISGKSIRGRVIAARLDDRGGAGGESGSRGARPARRPFDKGRGRSEGRSEGGPRGAGARGEGRSRSFGDRERPRRRDDDFGGPRSFRGDGPGRRPRAMGEDREWRERGERLKNARRPSRSRPGSQDR